MHMDQTSRPAPFGAIAAYSVVRAAADLRERLVAWNNARRTLKALTRLSDRELDDIGLTRSEVFRAALGQLR